MTLMDRIRVCIPDIAGRVVCPLPRTPNMQPSLAQPGGLNCQQRSYRAHTHRSWKASHSTMLSQLVRCETVGLVVSIGWFDLLCWLLVHVTVDRQTTNLAFAPAEA